MNLDYGAPAVEKGIPVTQIICRIELQRILVNAVGNDIVISNSKVVDFVTDADKVCMTFFLYICSVFSYLYWLKFGQVTVLLENGEKHEGDILVGADGIRSMVRQKLFGGQHPKYANFICYSGVAEFHPQYLPHFGYACVMTNNINFY